jgi:hypothetical protein
LLVVLISTDLQKGQILGATLASVGWGRMARSSALVSLPHPSFGYPLMADASEVKGLIAPTPRCREHEHRDRDTDAQDDPHGIHERRPVPARTVAGTPSHRGMMMGGTRTIMANNSALGRGDVPATTHESKVSEVALAATHKRRWREDMQVQPFARVQKQTTTASLLQWLSRGKRSQSLSLPTRSVAHPRSGGALGSAPHTAIR